MRPFERSAPRIVLDTQVLLRGAFARTESVTARIYFAWRDGRLTLLVSGPILAEIDDVLRRAEVLQKFRVTPLEAHALFSLVRRRAVSLTPLIGIQRSRDPGDDKFLECAVAGAADYVVSADADLLILGRIDGIPILDPPTFWEQVVRQP